MLPHYHQVRIEVQSSYLASSDSTLAGSGRGPTKTSNGYSLLLHKIEIWRQEHTLTYAYTGNTPTKEHNHSHSAIRGVMLRRSQEKH